MNILIVDDDKLIRTWMNLLLRQIKGYDFTISEAANVEDARSILRSAKIDLMFIDVKMPGESGLDLLQELYPERRDLEIVVLSAFDDFNYVRTALKFGAVDYILKPEMNIDDIHAILDKIHFSKMLEQNDTELGDSGYLLANNRFSDFLNEKTDSRMYLEKIFPDLKETENVCIIGLSLDAPIHDENMIIKLCSSCKKMLQLEGLSPYCLFYKKSILFALFRVENSIPEIRNELPERIVYKLRNFISDSTKYGVSYAIYKIFLQKEHLDSQIRECVQKVENDIYYHNCPKEQESFSFDNMQQIMRSITRKLEMRAFRDACVIFRELVDSAHRSHVDHKMIKSLIINIITLFYTYSDVSYNENNAKISLHEYTVRINQITTRKEADELVEEFSQQLGHMVVTTKPVNSQITMAMEYMKANYMTKMTLDSVADHVYLNASYFSQLFKKQTGVSFSDYLENLRLQNAKHLLETSNLSVTDISEAVGFSSQNYFTTVFKKKVGISPLRYRAAHHHNN